MPKFGSWDGHRLLDLSRRMARRSYRSCCLELAIRIDLVLQKYCPELGGNHRYMSGGRNSESK